jgi:hypothetical protein
MGAIASWLNELDQSKEVDLIVDETHAGLKRRDKIIDEYFPVREYDDIDFLAYVVNRVNTVASIISYNSAIPVTKQGRFVKLTTQLVKIALQRQYDEKTQWDMEKVLRNANAKMITVQDRMTPDGYVIKGENDTLANYIFGTIKDLTLAITDTLNLLTFHALQFGEVNYTDFRSNTTTVIDYKDPDATYNHFPPALVAIGNGADPINVAWTDSENANGIERLQADIDTFEETNGFSPDAIIMSRKTRNLLLNQKSTKEAARSSMAVPQVGTISQKQLNDILEEREVPPIITFDERYQVENEAGEVIRGRFLNENRYSFLTKQMGLRAFGPTLESKEGDMYGEPRTGIYVRSFQKSKSPILDVTEAMATAIPVVPNPKLLFSRQVAS